MYEPLTIFLFLVAGLILFIFLQKFRGVKPVTAYEKKERKSFKEQSSERYPDHPKGAAPKRIYSFPIFRSLKALNNARKAFFANRKKEAEEASKISDPIKRQKAFKVIAKRKFQYQYR